MLAQRLSSYVVDFQEAATGRVISLPCYLIDGCIVSEEPPCEGWVLDWRHVSEVDQPILEATRSR